MRIRLTFEVKQHPDNVAWEVRLRRLLKYAKRVLLLECVECVEDGKGSECEETK